MCWSYWAGRELGAGWSELFSYIPEHIRHNADFKEAYDRGVGDYAEFEEADIGGKWS